MIGFSKYQAAVDETLKSILAVCVQENLAVKNLVAAMASEDQQQIEAATASLMAKQQQIVDAVTGIISSIPSPAVPTPVPAAAGGEIPPLVIPEVPSPAPTEPTTDPEVPVTVEPSPSGVGVDGGSSITA